MAIRRRKSTRRKTFISRGRRLVANPRGGMFLSKYASNTSVGRSRTSGSYVHSFKRMLANPTSYTGNVAYAPLLQCWTWQFSQLQNVSEFTNLYDQYRINFVVVKYFLKIDPGAQAAGTASYPKLYWYRDLDDSNAPLSLNEIRENARSRVKVMNPNRPVVIKYKPNSLQLIYTSAIANQFKPAYSQWMDVAQTGTPHYGHKWAIDDLTNTNYKVETEVTYYFQCRNPR